MASKTIISTAWILMLMVIVEASGAAVALTAVVDEVGSPRRLLRTPVTPSGPSHCHNNNHDCHTLSSPSELSDEINE